MDIIESKFWDTNAYRELLYDLSFSETRKKMRSIRGLETSHSISVLPHIYVLVELLCHLSNPDDPAFDNCRNGIIGIWSHCLDKISGRLQFISDSDSMLAKRLLNAKIIGTENFYQRVFDLCEYINENDTDKHLNEIRDNLVLLDGTVKEEKKRFIDRYKKFIEYIDPNSIDWRVYVENPTFKEKNLKFLNSEEAYIEFSKHEIKKIANWANVDLTQKLLDECSQYIRKNFRLHLELNIEILRRMIISGFDLSKKYRSTLYWDLKISACVFKSSHPFQTEVSLITSDRMILDCAKKVGYNKEVVKLSDYLFTIGFSDI